MNKPLELAQAQFAAGKTYQQIANEIGKGRSAVSLWMRGKYIADGKAIEALVLKAYDRRICPVDGEEKRPEQCRRISLSPRPHGFTDAETLWKSCQTCPHKPEVTK